MLFIAIPVLALAAWLFFRHQQRLKQRAWLMQEAIRNRDFQFRISTRGLLWGECAMQEALNNIGQELKRQIAENEVESWRRLTRVLTHEIMNATAPIASISQSFLSHPDVKGKAIEDGIRAIHDTCSGLNTFVENYHKLTQLQTPKFSCVNLRSLVENVEMLYPAIGWNVGIGKDLAVKADEGLLRQVLINLAKNATEAGARTIMVAVAPVRDTAQRSNAAGVAQGRPLQMEISNDGAPIPPDMRRDIFTPFFTTKKTGSGIGLSLSRQIMVMQGCDLALADIPSPGYHATFIISPLQEDCMQA